MADTTTQAKEKHTKQLEAILRVVNTGLANSALYPDGHPRHASSASSVLDALAGWLQTHRRLELGFTPEGLLLGGEPIDGKGGVFRAFADHFFNRGLLALRIKSGISADEVGKLLEAAQGTPEEIAEAGGLSRKLRGCPHIAVKQIDFSPVVSGVTGETATDPDKLWKTLCSLTDDASEVSVTPRRATTLRVAMKNGDTVAAALNHAYSTGGEGSAKQVYRVLHELCVAQGMTPEDQRPAVTRMLGLVAKRLNPDLVLSLFKADTSRKGRLIQDEIVNLYSEEDLVEFVLSLLTQRGEIDETVLSLFDRLSQRTSKSVHVAEQVATALARMNQGGEADSAGICAAMSEAMKKYHENPFMSAVYKLTVDALPGQTVLLDLPSGVRALVAEHEVERSAERKPLLRIRMLLNVLWYEGDAEVFACLVNELMEELTRVSLSAHPQITTDLARLYAAKVARGPEKLPPAFRPALARVAAKLDREVFLGLIPGANEVTLRGIGNALKDLGEPGVDALFHAWRKAADEDTRPRMAALMASMTSSPDQVQNLAAKIRQLDSSTSRKALLGALVRTRRPVVYEGLFSRLHNRLSVSPAMYDLIAVTADQRLDMAVPHLETLCKQGLRAGWLNHTALRQAAEEGLRRIGSPAALRALTKMGGTNGRGAGREVFHAR